MSNTHTACLLCLDTGARNGEFCACAIGVAWQLAPRVCIGNEILVFPPGTTMAEAQSVIDDGVRLAAEGLS